MRILKIIIGTLAALYVFGQVSSLIATILSPPQVEGALMVSRYGGHIFGICIGTIVAIACFRPSKPKRKHSDV